ncbi:MFS transporter [Leucobacter komagatae]|uniref:MFS transporter n=1 Tax=Leucobacter komagatae TaxID=55969 RepID=UPI000B090FC5|nr:MFS transporter [Leucobacter komagatae]
MNRLAARPASGWVIPLLVCTALVVLTQLYAAIPLIVPVGADLGGDVTFALSSAFSLCYAIGFLVWGPLADQFGRRRILLVGLCGLAIATCGVALAQTVPVLGLLRSAQGFIAASFAPVALAYLSEAVAPARRGLAVGAMSTAFLVAGVLGQVVPELVAIRVGWQSFFLGSGALLAAAAIGVALWAREPRRGADGDNLPRRFVRLAQVAARPSVLLLALAHVTLLLSLVAMYTALGPHLVRFGLDPSQVVLLRLVGLPGMFASLLTGRLAKRIGVAGVARAGFAIAGIGLACEALLVDSLPGTALASLVFVTGVALAVPTMIGLFGESAAPNRASGMALNGFVLFVGASIGPLAGQLDLSFQWLLAGLAGLMLLGVVWLTLFRRLSARPARGEPRTTPPSRLAS